MRGGFGLWLDASHFLRQLRRIPRRFRIASHGPLKVGFGRHQIVTRFLAFSVLQSKQTRLPPRGRLAILPGLASVRLARVARFSGLHVIVGVWPMSQAMVAGAYKR